MTQFTINELNKLYQICDVATKAGGLQIAQEIIPLLQKMQQIAKEIQEASSNFNEISE